MVYPLWLLLVENSEEDSLHITRHLEHGGYHLICKRVETSEALQAALARCSWDIIIASYALPCFSALQALTVVKAYGLDIPFIVISRSGGEERVVEVMRAGAHDYLLWDDLRRLVPAIERELHEARVRREHRRGEQMPGASERRFRAMIEHSADCVTLLDAAGTILYTSPSVATITGFTAEERTGYDGFELIHPDDVGAVREIFTALLHERGAMATFETRSWHRDGTYRWLKVTASNWLAEPSIQAIVVNYHDITESKHALDALRRSEERFARTFHASPIPIVISRLDDGCLLHMNRSFLNLVGYPLEAVMGRTSVELGFWHDEAERDVMHQQLRYGLSVQGVNLQFRTAAGDIRDLMAWIELIDLEGEPCTLTMLSDMTERHWAEACQSTQFTVTRILAEADTIDEALPGVLETICQKFGWHAGEMWQLDSSVNVLRRGCTWYVPELATTDFVTLAASMAFQRGEGLAGACWQQGETLWLHDMGTTATGSCRRITVAQQAGLHNAIFCPVRTATTFDGVMCFFSYRVREYDAMLAETMTDIGSQVSQFLHRKQTEEALAIERASLKQRVAQATLELSRMNAELSRAMRAKDEFLATMSHELRTPLNAVLGLTESLQEQIYGPLNERQLKSLRTIEASSRHLLTLINDILDVSKIEAGKLELQFDILSVETLCETSMLFIQQQALQKSIYVSCNLECAPHTIEGDARRLKQILINLLSNAVKFTPEGGKVGLDVTSSEGDDIIHFTVWDTGIGIAPEYQRKLFKPFVQLDSSLSKAHQGTGLGLALVARLTELHNGSVALQSELGAGSRFTISLPMSAPPMAEQGAATSATETPTPLTTNAPPGTDEAGYTATPGDTHLDDGRSTLLIAEDNEQTIQMLQSYLEEVGYRVVVARNGVEAIIRATEEPPALILMDMQMPEMSGMEALHSLRATPRFTSIPIIAMTALAMSGDRERCLLAGANEYLSKPVSLKRLRMMIEALLLEVRAPTL